MIVRIAVLGVLVAGAVPAFAEGNAVAAKAGGLGLGVEYTYAWSDRVAFRAGINGSSLGFDAEESGIDYQFDLVWDSVSLAADFHPLRSAFRLTGGFLLNDNRLEVSSRPIGDTTIGDTTYTPAEVGTLSGLVSFDDTAPFVGLGWDWSRGKRLFGISFDLGVVSQGSPTVDLRGSGTLLGNPAFESDLAAEEVQLRDELDFDLLPYATLGFVFRF